jgi:ubiquitin-protein ligase
MEDVMEEDDIRQSRLWDEFDLMKALIKPHALVQFWCADLSGEETSEFLRTKMSFDVITEGFPGFLTPEAFEKQYPDIPPEKYMIKYDCTGLWKRPDGTIADAPHHLMQVVFGMDYPSNPPAFVWLTPIWHPNLKRPYICLEGRPFAVGWTLDLIVQEVGRLVQYQSYNLKDPLNHEAADWARDNAQRFPVDDRDLLDYRVKVRVVRQESPGDEQVVEMVGETVELDDPDALVEVISCHL